MHRSDGSGTTYIWVDYLAKVSPEWKTKVGVATSVNWPTGVGQKGNEGVAGQVLRSSGSIGYIELIYALQNEIEFGLVQNREGEFIRAGLESVTAAADSLPVGHPRRPALLDHERPRQGFLPHQRDELGTPLREPASGERPARGRFPPLGDPRRAALHR